MALSLTYRVGILLMIVSILFTFTASIPLTSSDYLKMRSEIIDENEKMRIGGDLVLSPSEQIVNTKFMKEKLELIESCRVNRTVFLPSTSFFTAKSWIDTTYLFQLIHRMPKGAALHTHDQSMVSLDWVISNVTYRPNVYMCLWSQSYLFSVFKAPPSQTDCEWKLVSKERESAKDVKAFDLMLRNNLSLATRDPFEVFPDNQAAWMRFSRYFKQIGKLMYYIPIFRDMLWQTMEEFHEANVQYIEVRVNYNGLYDLDGKVYSREYCVQLVKNVTDAFVQKYPDFVGMKIIFSGIRFQNVSDILTEIKDVMELHRKYPDVVGGYDIAGNEDLYKPFSFYADALLYPSQQDPPYRLPYFLHAGESMWQGTETSYNMVDALLLNATRVGHAYALSKHPYLMKLYKERGIPLEVQPVSNQVLRLVSDFRNHPMASLIAQNFSLVISCDDRTSLSSAPLSHDFYIVFTAMSSERADITLLKQLAMNSIRFSTLDDEKKSKAMQLWQTKWDMFIDDVINEKYSPTPQPVMGQTTHSQRNNCNIAGLHAWISWWTSLIFIGLTPHRPFYNVLQ